MSDERVSGDDPRRFTVAPDGVAVELDARSADHEPDAESRRRAKLLAGGGNFAPDAEDFFARGIAVARSGGNVEAWLREQIGKRS